MLSSTQGEMKSKLTPELAEFVGALIGDGYLSFASGSGAIGFVGHPTNDKLYFDYLQKLFLDLFGLNASITIRARGLRMRVYSNDLFNYLTQELGLCHGAGKGQKVKIPDIFLNDESLSNAVLRGIFDTDGSVFTSDKKGSPNYPAVELSTTSYELAKQVKYLLIEKGFRVAGIRSYTPSNGRVCHKLSLYGLKNICRFIALIGSSNPYKLRRLKLARSGTAGI